MERQSPGPCDGAQLEPQLRLRPLLIFFLGVGEFVFVIFTVSAHHTAIIFSNGSLGAPRRVPRPVVSSTLEGRGSLEWSMSGCHYPSLPAPERERRYQHKVSLVVRYFMIPCNICLILLATSTLGFAVLLFLNNYKPSHFTPAQPPDAELGAPLFVSAPLVWLTHGRVRSGPFDVRRIF
ncbi:hypothetical protein CRENBAI_026438 [Crenichthys baileyi]|uniref:Agrin n=1 Tax=Crenichthys baileyi TaxID=28760 RepID=A0AAV9RPC8_9TELE